MAEPVSRVFFPIEGEHVIDAARTDALHAHTESAGGGWYPVGSNTCWHGGVHVVAAEGTGVVACAEGVVVAARLASASAAAGAIGSRNFILMRHVHGSGATFFTLCMHLAPRTDRSRAEALPWLDRGRVEGGDPAAAGFDDALWASLEGDGVVTPGRRVLAGERLWWVGEVGPSAGQGLEVKRPLFGKRPEQEAPPDAPAHGLHWEAFSGAPLFADWTVVTDENTDCFMDAAAIEGLFPASARADGRLLQAELTAFYTAGGAAVLGLRTTVCRFQSEWSLDWGSKELRRALRERRYKTDDVEERFAPYSWWGEVASTLNGLVHTVAPGEYLSLLAERHAVEGGWEAIYEHPSNAAFRALRPDPDLIEPGDQVFIPGAGEVLPDPLVHHMNPVALLARLDAEYWSGYWATPAVARLELLQEADALGGRTLLASCALEAPGVTLATTPADLGLAWGSTDELPPFGVAALAHGGAASPGPLERNRDGALRVRSRAQRAGFPDRVRTVTEVDRGGYHYAAADAPDAELDHAKLWPKSGHPAGEKRHCVRLSLGGAAAQLLPVLHPWPLPPVEQRHGEVVLTLHAELVLTADAGEERRALAGPRWRFSAAGFIGDEARFAAGTLEAHLTEQYGNPAAAPPIHARTAYYRLYRGERGNAATMATWRASIASAVEWVNAHLPPGFVAPITPFEVGVTFLTEGGFLILDAGGSDPRFHGYNALGIDTLLVRYDADDHGFRSYMHPDLVALSRDPAHLHVEPGGNEIGDRVKTLKDIRIPQACQAVAAMVANAKRQLAEDLADAAHQGRWAMQVPDLPAHLQYYWTTVNYNTHPKVAVKYLTDYGLELHDRAWSKEDDHLAHSGQSKYNCSWRQATFNYFLAGTPTWLP